ncbi:MAG: DUF4434 domain-containing protein [Thermotogae bacterium]|nr:DUF4434 domain-containing protein [Thermotogota bacterium]
MYKKITGTFLDEITYDIASSNWGEKAWAKEFTTMKEAGIDTVIIIRAGLGEKIIFNSETISKYKKILPVYQDLASLFLKLASENKMKLFFGLYDSNYFWYRNDWKTEVKINVEFADEIWEKFGENESFAGWYLPHETADTSMRIIDINTTLAKHLKEKTKLPILISPYFLGKVDPYSFFAYGERATPRSADEHIRQWEEIFENFKDLVNYCAFQDGTVNLFDLEEFVKATSEISKKNKIELWSNVETFDRDVPIKFPPIDYRKLFHKMDVVQPYVNKLITFEFSHFLSPNSIWPSARNLFERYKEFLLAKK